MAKVRIITDITAHLEPDIIEQHKIKVLPVEIRFGDVVHVVSEEEQAQDLFAQMAEGPAQSSSVTISA